jgi:hypothetical protein
MEKTLMPETIYLPHDNNLLKPYSPRSPQHFEKPTQPFTKRKLFAAAHVVAEPDFLNDPHQTRKLDWETTLQYRHHLWSYGFAIAEAMDTAQRGMGLDWNNALQLIRQSATEARAVKGAIAAGAGTDQLPPLELGLPSLERIEAAYLEQCEAIEATGAQIILMASRHLAAVARHAGDYERVYTKVLSQTKQPVILHWLGEMFDPMLAGYWGSKNLYEAAKTVHGLIAAHPNHVDGIKISLLDADREIEFRRKLPTGVRMYTGDDFNYAELIQGDQFGYSDGLLGIFDAIAPAASAALQALERDDWATYNALLLPTVPLSRHIFESPTYHYKTGVVFLAYLNGFQSHFQMVAGMETTRSKWHLAEIFRRADKAGLLRDPDLACGRMRQTLDLVGA